MKTVFFDVDTQLDFLYPAGALYVPGAEAIVDRIAALNRFAAASGIALVSTMDAHTENDPHFKEWPPHCVARTLGQRKPAATLVDQRCVIPNAAGEFAPDGARQILVEKQANDCFTNVNLAGLLNRLAADRYVVYGVATEICVQCATDGLFAFGKRVELVTDAIRGLTEDGSKRMMEAFTAKGGVLTTLSAVTGVPQAGLG
jgi:nicotinamidase/pyrazinamidase